MTRDQSASLGAGCGLGAGAPGSAAARYTVRCSSVVASPLGPEISWRTVTKHSAPDRPSLDVTSLTVDNRVIGSPAFRG